MKQKIKLTPANRRILIDQYQADPEKLTSKYWQQQLLANQERILALLSNTQGSPDAQIRIIRRANRDLQAYVRSLVGLPKPSGGFVRQRRYQRRLTRSGLK